MMKMKIFKYIGFFLLAFSVSGILLHALYRLDIISHSCKYLLPGASKDHLLIYTITAMLAATLFSILKRKRKQLI
jgi:hypothetical protein